MTARVIGRVTRGGKGLSCACAKITPKGRRREEKGSRRTRERSLKEYNLLKSIRRKSNHALTASILPFRLYLYTYISNSVRVGTTKISIRKLSSRPRAAKALTYATVRRYFLLFISYFYQDLFCYFIRSARQVNRD